LLLLLLLRTEDMFLVNYVAPAEEYNLARILVALINRTTFLVGVDSHLFKS